MDSLLAQLAKGSDLSAPQVRKAAEWLLDESVSPDNKTEFLRALADKGESPREVAAFVQVFLEHARDPHIRVEELQGPVIDVCGTGGDRLGLFNVSTAAMFVVAGAGAVVVKHGNRGVTSKSGGADVLEALGVRIDMQGADLQECLRKHRAAFLFAPHYHPAFKAVAPARKLLAAEGITSIFNMLGPLLNPARPPFQLVGVFTQKLLEIYPAVFKLLGRKRAWIVHGFSPEGPMDEFSTLGENRVAVYEDESTSIHTVDPAGLGFSPALVEDLAGGTPHENASAIEAVLQGSLRGARRDIVLLNAGAALAVCGIASNLTIGVRLATESIDSGKAMACLDGLRSY